MQVVKKIGNGLALVACLAMLSSTASASHIKKGKRKIKYRDISAVGNFSTPHTGVVDVRFNTKSKRVSIKGSRGKIRNSSGIKFSAKKLPGPIFGIPPQVGISARYKVSEGGKIHAHDETAKIRGRN